MLNNNLKAVLLKWLCRCCLRVVKASTFVSIIVSNFWASNCGVVILENDGESILSSKSAAETDWGEKWPKCLVRSAYLAWTNEVDTCIRNWMCCQILPRALEKKSSFFSNCILRFYFFIPICIKASGTMIKFYMDLIHLDLSGRPQSSFYTH